LHVVDLELLELQFDQLIELTVRFPIDCLLLNRTSVIQRVVEQSHIELNSCVFWVLLIKLEAQDELVRDLLVELVLLVRVQGLRVLCVVEHSEIPDLALEDVMILVTIVSHLKSIDLLSEDREAVVLRMDARHLYFVDLDLNTHQDGHVIEAGRSRGTEV